ncbi:branched-chain amino acid transport system ATP-binding protein [Variovorax boronicumulans]|jgi:branched-chain amino acid transport system ATP-binding protein|uniref:ABC transporter ATP-binding protein n=1 Tax=Variovorax boronicumulans TaxID=436515 RepID=UPI002783FE84|nr:ABC transporter ATP-binding protein [Variovorax boronicumulans]MDP9995206.1 branched-chain amino acid transport system ATP-binding protein [Variovorax boronicumulans]MDQ0006496.1 branched-chain amino acid transport system ATP-binding protein [Variovorax boronicumulans]MDQ0038426.1 branched-chain amino acid transport system ATP-binding protein [Variovorax boronicumulans]
MSRSLLQVQGLVKTFGGIKATDDLHLDIKEGELHALIGPNGAGKTTLIAQLAGMLEPTSGRILFDGEDVTRLDCVQRVRRGIARSFQITSLWPTLSLVENVVIALQARTEGHAFRFWERARDVASLRDPALQLLERVGLRAKAHRPTQTLSHGEQRQLELAVTLGTGPRLLLLDEPMAGMGIEDSQRMVTLLRELRAHYTILLIEHDMDAVFSLADRISVLVYGHCVATGTPDAIRTDAQVRAAYLGEEV